MTFKDHFSKQAADYARFRPQYPRALFQFIASLAPNDQLAVDVATGNGQAAIALSEFFQRVVALDASETQIASALPNERVTYRIAPAEQTGLADNSCDAITVAQALHWFDLEAFYRETRRVLKSRGVLAVWAYNDLTISAAIDPIVRHFHDEIVGPFWPPERKMVGRRYRELPFPFMEVATPEFRIEVSWSISHLVGYLRTWSATQRFRAEKGRDPVEEIVDELAAGWGDAAQVRTVAWPLTVRIGRT